MNFEPLQWLLVLGASFVGAVVGGIGGFGTGVILTAVLVPILGVKATVIGQYGHNSDAVQAIGLKKKTDYRRPGRRRVTSAA